MKELLAKTIEAERVELEQSNNTETMYRLQGRIGALKELLHAIDASREVIRQHS